MEVQREAEAGETELEEIELEEVELAPIAIISYTSHNENLQSRKKLLRPATIKKNPQEQQGEILIRYCELPQEEEEQEAQRELATPTLPQTVEDEVISEHRLLVEVAQEEELV